MVKWMKCVVAAMLVCVPASAWADDPWFEVAPTLEVSAVYDHRFVQARSPEEEVDRLSNYAAGWAGVRVRTPAHDYKPLWGTFMSLGVRVEPPAVARLAVVPSLRVGHIRQFARSSTMFEEVLFRQTVGLSMGLLLSDRWSVAGGRFGLTARQGIFVFELVTELDFARRAPRWIFSGGVGF